jgi:hypothetical protein
MGAPIDGALSAQLLAPSRASRIKDLAATVGRHAGAETVTALAHQFARLVGPFHGFVSAACLTSGKSLHRLVAAVRLARLIREAFRPVNVTFSTVLGGFRSVWQPHCNAPRSVE